MLVLALGLLAQSFIEMSGQTHETLLHANAGETYTHHHGPHDHEAPLPGDTEQPVGDTLHLLMHQPCSGHCVWIPGVQIAHRPAGLIAAAAAFDRVTPLPSADYTAPFRPPIRA
jgi:hypothetical protein